MSGRVQSSDETQWSRFRGANGSGISNATSVPTEWTEKDYNWSIELPGRGHSSPIAWGNRLFVTSCDEKTFTRFLICVDAASGDVLWKREFPFARYKKHKNNSYASSTPSADKDHVYVLWHSKESSPLIAFDHQGEQVWEYDLGPYLHGQGGATSPIVHGDLVVAAHDHKNDSFLVAVDRNSGKESWKIPREGKRACYSTPCVRETDSGSELVFVHCFEGVTGINPDGGTLNWHIDVFGRASQRALGSPVVAGDLVFACSGGVSGDKQLVAIHPDGAGQESATEVYRITRQAPHVPSPLVHGSHLFLWSDGGIVSCVAHDTGKVIWQKRVGGNFFSSPVCIDGRLFCVDLEGEVVVLAASEEYELLARNVLGKPTRATPAVSGGVLYLRTESNLFSIGGAEKK